MKIFLKRFTISLKVCVARKNKMLEKKNRIQIKIKRIELKIILSIKDIDVDIYNLVTK